MTHAHPTGVTFLRATRAPTPMEHVLTWPTSDSLAVNASRTDTVVVLATSAVGTVVNAATSTAGTLDPAAANNNGSAPVSRATTPVTTSVAVTPDGLSTPTRRLRRR